MTQGLASILADKQAGTPTDELDLLAEGLVECMDKLSEADRHLIHLCYAEEQAITQIAEELGRPVQSVYNSLFRIRRTLFDCIQRAASRRGDA